MGSCVSVDKKAHSDMKFRLCLGSFNFKTKKDFIPSTPTKDNGGEYPVSVLSFASPKPPPLMGIQDFGSKEETFFDSQAWLDSDCDDDFLSVKGDFTPSCGNTPSRGNTPNFQSRFVGTPQLNKSFFMEKSPNSKIEPSPTEKKKRLSELFQETFEVNEGSDDQNGVNGFRTTKLDFKTNTTNGTPYMSRTNSVCSSKSTPNKGSKPEKEKLSRSVQCCLPSFAPSRRSSEKKMLSPGENGG